MITNIFAVIQLILKALKLWDQFVVFVDTERTLEEEKKNQDRAKAVDDALKAQTAEEAYEAQQRIVDSDP
jgi:hypothetical protein